MTKGMKHEWEKIKEDLQVTQHMRGREVINEIIDLTKNFGNAIGKCKELQLFNIIFLLVCADSKFQKFKDDDEEGYVWEQSVGRNVCHKQRESLLDFML